MSLDRLATKLPPGLQRGTVTVQNREAEYQLPTSTHPQEEPVARMSGIGGGIPDSSITVIENPFVYGCLGLLLAMHFNQQRYGTIDLTDVLHIRVTDLDELIELNKFDRIAIAKGFDTAPYNFVATDSGLILPCPSLLPYEIVFAETSVVAEFRDELELEMDIGAVLERIYEHLNRKVPAFRLEGGGCPPLLPKDYANIALERL